MLIFLSQLFVSVLKSRGKEECFKVQPVRCRLDTRRKKGHSKSSATVNREVPLRESGSAQGFVCHIIATCKSKVKVRKVLRREQDGVA